MHGLIHAHGFGGVLSPRLEPPFLLGAACAWWAADTGVTAADSSLQEPNTWPGTQWNVSYLTPTSGQPDPVGGSDATQFLETTDSGAHRVTQTLTSSDDIVAGPGILGCHVKSTGDRWFWVYTASHDTRAKFDIVSGSGASVEAGDATARLTSEGGDWYKCEVDTINVTTSFFMGPGTQYAYAYAGDVSKGVYLYTAEARQHRCSGWTSRALSGGQLVAGPVASQATDANQFFGIRDSNSPGWSATEQAAMWCPLDVDTKRMQCTDSALLAALNAANGATIIMPMKPLGASSSDHYPFNLVGTASPLCQFGAGDWTPTLYVAGDSLKSGPGAVTGADIVVWTFDFTAKKWEIWVGGTKTSGSFTGTYTFGLTTLEQRLRMMTAYETVVGPPVFNDGLILQVQHGMRQRLGWS